MAFETLKSPVLGLGCWVFGNAAPDSPQERTALEVMREALTLGVRNFDTAQDYGNGRSETLVGRALAGHPEAFIATKMHLTDPVSFVRKLEESRTRLIGTLSTYFIFIGRKRAWIAAP